MPNMTHVLIVFLVFLVACAIVYWIWTLLPFPQNSPFKNIVLIILLIILLIAFLGYMAPMLHV